MTNNQTQQMIKQLSDTDFESLYQMIDAILKTNDLDYALINFVIQEKNNRDMIARIRKFKTSS